MHFRSVAFVILGIVQIDASLKRKFDQVTQPSVSPGENSSPMGAQRRRVEVFSGVDHFFSEHIRVPKALLPILTSDDDFAGKLAASRPLMGNKITQSSLLKHWLQYCAFGLQLHALKPLNQAPCAVVGDELVMSEKMKENITARRASIGFVDNRKWPPTLNPSWSADRAALELLAEYPSATYSFVQKATKGKVVVPHHRWNQLGEILKSATQIPIWLHQVFVKAHFAPSWESIVEAQRALDRHTLKGLTRPVQYHRQLSHWAAVCLEPLHAWFSNPVGEIPCELHGTGEFMILPASKRRLLVQKLA